MQINNLDASKVELESRFNDIKDRLNDQEQRIEETQRQVKRTEKEKNALNEQINLLNDSVNRVEQEKNKTENQIQEINENIIFQDDAIAKVNREKKRTEESNRILSEGLQTESEKNAQSVRSKTKVERSIEDVEDSLDRERRHRVETEKTQKKFETDFNLVREQIDEVKKRKNEIDSKQQRIDDDLRNLFAQIDDQASITGKSQRKIRENLDHIMELEEELEVEQHVHAKIDKTRKFIQAQLDSLNDFIDKANHKTIEQNELNRKKEIEIARLRQVLQAQNQRMENDLCVLRKRYLDETITYNDRLDAIQTATSKSEKEKEILRRTLNEIVDQISEETKAKIDKERFAKHIELQISELQIKCDENYKYIQVTKLFLIMLFPIFTA